MNRETVNGKPVVHFIGSLEYHKLIDSETANEVEIAVVYGVQDHPRLGRLSWRTPVYTSEVLVKCEDGSAFETRNTFYRRLDTTGKTWSEEGQGPSLG